MTDIVWPVAATNYFFASVVLIGGAEMEISGSLTVMSNEAGGASIVAGNQRNKRQIINVRSGSDNLLEVGNGITVVGGVEGSYIETELQYSWNLVVNNGGISVSTMDAVMFNQVIPHMYLNELIVFPALSSVMNITNRAAWLSCLQHQATLPYKVM